MAAAAGRLIIAGGTSGDAALRAIYAFDPATGRVTRIGSLPHPLTHAAAAALGARVYVIGGRRAGVDTQTREILAIDPATGSATPAGHLPHALSDVGAATVGGRIIVAGGRGRTGVLSDQIYSLSPRVPAP